MLKTQKYDRKPFSVEAVRVTQENLMEVLEWCAGVLFPASGKLGPFVKVEVRRPISERQTRAYIGDWVLKAGSGFKVYNDRAFFEAFQLSPGLQIVNRPFPGEPEEMQEVVVEKTPLPPIDAYISTRDRTAYFEAMARARFEHPSNFPRPVDTSVYEPPKPGPFRRALHAVPVVEQKTPDLPDDYWAGHPTD